MEAWFVREIFLKGRYIESEESLTAESFFHNAKEERR